MQADYWSITNTYAERECVSMDICTAIGHNILFHIAANQLK